MATVRDIEREKAFGQFLLEKNIISEEQLALALKLQKEGKKKYLGQILMEMGVPQEEIRKALDQANKRKPVGQILVDLGIVTSQQIEVVLEKQKKLQGKGIRKPLGMLLVEMGFATYQEYLNALSAHFNMPVISLGNFRVSPSLQKSIGDKYALANKIVVLENNEETIKLALAEPTDFILDEIRRIIPPNKKVEFYLTNPSDVEHCLRKHFDPFALNLYH